MAPEKMKDQLKEILNVLTDIDSGLIKDRTALDDLKMAIHALDQKLNTLYDRLPRTEEKIKNAVADGLAETMAPAVDLMDNLKQATRRITQPQVKRKWTISNLFGKRGDTNV